MATRAVTRSMVVRPWRRIPEVQPQRYAFCLHRDLRPLSIHPANLLLLNCRHDARIFSDCHPTAHSRRMDTHTGTSAPPPKSRVPSNGRRRSELSLIEPLTGFAIGSCICLQSLVCSCGKRRRFARRGAREKRVARTTWVGIGLVTLPGTFPLYRNAS